MSQYQSKISFGNKSVFKTAVRMSCCCLVQCYTQSTTGREIQLMAKPAEYKNEYINELLIRHMWWLKLLLVSAHSKVIETPEKKTWIRSRCQDLQVLGSDASADFEQSASHTTFCCQYGCPSVCWQLYSLHCGTKHTSFPDSQAPWSLSPAKQHQGYSVWYINKFWHYL